MPGSSRHNWEEEANAAGSSVPGIGVPPGAIGDLTPIPPPPAGEDETLFAVVETTYPKIIWTNLVYPFEDAESIAQKAALVELVNGQRIMAVIDLSWEDVEAVENTLVWTKYDVIVTWANANQIDIMFNIVNVPEWASGDADNQVPPTDPTDFADFAAAAAQKYGPYGDYILASTLFYPVRDWMIWDGFPTAATYAPILVESYDALKGKSPRNRVFTGSMSSATAVASIGTIYSGGGLGKFDYATIAPYDGSAPISSTESGISALRTAMTAGGDDSQIFVKWGIKANSGDSAALSTYQIQMTKLFNDRADIWRESDAYGVYAVGWDSLSDHAAGNYGLLTHSSTPVHKALAFDAFKALISSDRASVHPYPKMINTNFAWPFGGANGTLRFNAMIDLKGARDQVIFGRTSLKWSIVQPTSDPDSANWTWSNPNNFGYDYLVTWAYENGVDLWFVIEEPAAWAGAPFGPADDPDDMAHFVEEVIMRYGVGGSFVSSFGTGNWGVRHFQIEAELNNSNHIGGGMTPTKYVAELIPSYAAAKAVTTDCVIICGGLAGGEANAGPYATALYAAGVKGHFDWFDTHPYSVDSIDSAETKVSNLRNLMNTNTDSSPICCGEWGIGNVSNDNRYLKSATYITEMFNIRLPNWKTMFNVTMLGWASLCADQNTGILYPVNASDAFADLTAKPLCYDSYKDSTLGR